MTHAAGHGAGPLRPADTDEVQDHAQGLTTQGLTTQGLTTQGWNTPRLRRAVAMGLWSGAGTLIPFWRIPRRPLMTVGGITAGVVATAGLMLVRDRTEREAVVQGQPLPRAGAAKRLGAPLLTGVAAGGVTAGVLWLSSVTDELSEKVVVRLGARRPRVTLAVIAAVSTVVLEYVDSRPDQVRDRDHAPAAVAAVA